MTFEDSEYVVEETEKHVSDVSELTENYINSAFNGATNTMVGMVNDVLSFAIPLILFSVLIHMIVKLFLFHSDE